MNPQKKCHKQIVPIFIRMSINISAVFISELTVYRLLTFIRKGFARIHEDLQDFGSGFARLWERIHEDSRGFVRFWEKIYKTLTEDSQDFGRGFMRICETLGEDS